MYRLLSLLLVLLSATAWGQTPKYVFYFIGDGMGMNQVNGTETYLAALEGRIGTKPLRFASFPHTAFATTHSASNGITDSAAGGTALATGHKTYNGALGLLPDSVTPVTSVAVWAKNAGAAVGIATSVSVDHATPASFYAHQTYRGKYHEVGHDLIRSGFPFFAGSDFLKPQSPTGGADLYTLCQQAGYTIARGLQALPTKQPERLILLQSEAASKRDRSSLPYAIDRTEADLTLPQITRTAIDFLARRPEGRFFLMVEGGKIDWACHSNDAATVVNEVVDFDNAIELAYAFYLQHPDETLIVVTADHETGGLGLGNSNYTLSTHLLRYQRMSATDYSQHVKDLMKRLGKDFTYKALQDDLRENFGFWHAVRLSEKQEDELEEAYDDLIKHRDSDSKSMYASELAIGALAKRILNDNARLGWTSGQHTNGYVPVFAIGAGAEQFHGRIDNIEIPRIIAKVAGY